MEMATANSLDRMTVMHFCFQKDDTATGSSDAVLVEHRSDHGSVGHYKHNALHFMTPVKGVTLVGPTERVPRLRVERQASQVLWQKTLFSIRGHFTLEINQVF